MNSRPRAPDLDRARAAIRNLLDALGFDSDDPALETSPDRTARAFAEVLTAGYDQTPAEALGEGYPVAAGHPVVASGIPLMFVCPHHLMPARGVAHLAFAPRDRVPGLSRLARLVDTLAHRLVLQEDLGQQLVDALMAHLDARAAVVVLEARHTCVAVEDPARADTVFRTRARAGAEADLESLERELSASLTPRWSTSS